MKTKFTFILFLCAFTFAIQAQEITIDPVHYVESHEGVDLTDNTLDLEAHVTVTNKTSEKIGLIWTRVVKENCPDEWDTQICDNESCYFYPISSNVSDETGLNVPFELEASEVFPDFILHVLPRKTPGCCRIKIEFANVNEPETLIETVVFDIGVNTPMCNFGTSTLEIAEAKLVSVFPNPVADAFTLSNNDVVRQVDVYNSLGQKLKSFDFVNGEYLDISDLNSGIYSLALKNQEGLVLHSLMLEKI